MFDIVTARALARLNIVAELCIPLVKKDGYFIAMKAKIKDEIEQADLALKKLDSEVVKTKKIFLPREGSTRTLIKIKKLNKTAKKYPRLFRQIKKNPL